MKKILIATSSFGEFSAVPLKRLHDEGFEIVTNPFKRKLKPEESFKLYTDGVCGVIAGTEDITAQLLEKAGDLKVISRCGTGLDNVDMKAAEKNRIAVFTTPDSPALAVAELTVALMLDLLRNISFMDAALKAGRWEKLMGSLLSGKKVGIIGFGRIGKKVAQLLMPFKPEVAYYDSVKQPEVSGCSLKSLKDLLAWADIVTVHVPGGDRPLLGETELRSMKKGSWLVNCSRGGVVDETVLYECLKEGHLAGAALDVFEQEPYSGPLLELDNCILTPHVGSYAREARIAMEMEAVENLIRGLQERGGR